MSYTIFDLETTIRNNIGNNKGSSHCPENRICYIGHKTAGKHIEPIVNNYTSLMEGASKLSIPYSGWATTDYDTNNLYVGHNFKFDLLYLLRYDQFRKEVFPKLLIWDTALVEFIITGQEHKFPSLNECAIKYGGTVKPDKVKELWDAGVDTNKIDSDLMTEYLTGDIINTEKVFLAQFEHCKEKGLLPLVWSQMSALKATTMMEHNGMKIDVKELQNLQYEKTRQLADIRATIFGILIRDVHPILSTLGYSILANIINMDSPTCISTILYGGELEYVVRETIGAYKTGVRIGTPRYKNTTNAVSLPPLCVPLPDWETKKKGTYKVGEEELNTLLSNPLLPASLELFISGILKVRELSKEVGTYINGIKELIYEDGCIHGNLQHTVAITGRLTSSNPNLQNITNRED